MPMQYYRSYFRKLKRLLTADKRRINQAFREEIRPRIQQYRRLIDRPSINNRQLRINDALDEIRAVLLRLRNMGFEDSAALPAIENIAREFVTQINSYQRANFRQQIVRAIGFDPTINETWLWSFLETAVQENVSFIKTIGTEYHNKVDSIILQGARRGQSITEMANQLTQVADVSVNRAKFIARDQLGSIHGDLVKRRQSEAGLKRFRWRDSDDQRVRRSHERFDGQIFTWKDGANGLYPGTDYNCRCTAEIVEEDLLEVAE
jgi:SPP1 gp7 family putative phage head morphogenesis protein